jgi:hypothetical protein
MDVSTEYFFYRGFSVFAQCFLGVERVLTCLQNLSRG